MKLFKNLNSVTNRNYVIFYHTVLSTEKVQFWGWKLLGKIQVKTQCIFEENCSKNKIKSLWVISIIEFDYTSDIAQSLNFHSAMEFSIKLD